MAEDAPQELKFNLPLAATLAGKAFEAYLEPTGSEGYQDVNVKAIQTTYLDAGLVTSSYTGILKVTLERAEDLPARNKFGVPTTTRRVVLSLGDSCGRSSVSKEKLNPTWNETFTIYAKSGQQPKLEVRVFDDVRMAAEEPLVSGGADVDMTPGQEKALKVALTGKAGGGNAYLKAVYMPFEGAGSALVNQIVTYKIRVPDDKPKDRMCTAANKPAEPAAAPAEPAAAADTKPVGDQHQHQPELSKSESAKAAAALSARIMALSQEQWAQAWRAVAHAAGNMDKTCGQLAPVAYVDCLASDTQVWFYRSPAREVVVAFRGTQKSAMKDMLTDLNLIPTSLEKAKASNPLAGLAEKARAVTGMATHKEEKMVHDGFLKAFEAVKAKVYQFVEQLTADKSGGRWRVYWTGHSLGGALATLAAYETATKEFQQRVNYDVSMFSYGAPRVGNKAFATAFNSLIPDSWRVTNHNDLVPTVPRMMGYTHVRHGVRLTCEGRFRFETEGVPDKVAALGIDPKLIDTYDPKSAEAKAEAKLSAEEMTWFEKLVGGDVDEHMEPFYLRTLSTALLSVRPDLRESMEAEMPVPAPKPQPPAKSATKGPAKNGVAAAAGPAAVKA